MRIENSASFLAAARAGMNLFAGSGWSCLAQSAKGPLPVGDGLAGELRETFHVDPNEYLDLAQLTTVIGATDARALEDFLRSRFVVTNFDRRYMVLEKLALKSIFTTNIDDLFELLLAKSTRHYLNDVYARGSAQRSNGIDLVKLHGSVRDLSRPFIFGPLDLASAAALDPDRWMLLRQRLRETPTLFTGYSLRDAGTLQSLRSGRGNQELPGDAWIQLRPGDDDAARIDYFKALGFQIVIGEIDELLDYLSVNVNDSPSEPSAPLDLTNIPSSGSSASRPLEDYFLGAAPSWSDVYATEVVKLDHYRTLVNNIDGGLNTLVSGIPGSGKTTLLMQVGAHVKFAGPRILLDSPSEPEAALLSRQVGDEKALILVDNVAGDIEALLTLTRLKNAVIIAADRDYNLSSVSHRISRAHVDARLAVSSTSKEDLQRIWKSIPVRIRRRLLEWPETSQSLTPTAWEMVRANLSTRTLDEKLVDYVGSIYRTDLDDALMLVLACYMHYARVPLSMDTAVAFFRDSIDDYRSLYEMFGSVGAMLTDYSGAEAVEDQDYFAARSMQVAESVLGNIPGSLLRRLLQQFHNTVSPLRVPAYDVFRRRGYDYRLYKRAFTSWVDGAEEYDRIMAKLEVHSLSQTHYVQQQKALFLAEHRQFNEAFSEIDRARGARKRVNWTIENTYNRILFRANVEKASAVPEAQSLCFRALDGLQGAYETDDRKGPHALVFADCALRLSEVVEPLLSRDYLERAQLMLREVMSGDEAWLERPKYVARDIARRLRDLA